MIYLETINVNSRESTVNTVGCLSMMRQGLSIGLLATHSCSFTKTYYQGLCKLHVYILNNKNSNM